jgi:uncharacterized membrane protein YdjX (TVP38/TMEM64 family)
MWDNWTEDLPRVTRRRLLLLLAFGLVALLLFFVAERFLGERLNLDPESLRNWLDERGHAAPIIFMLLMIAAIVFSPIPSVPLDIAAGLAFGLFWGTIYTLIGAEIGATIAFLLARRLGRPGLERWAGDSAVRAVDRFADRVGWRGIAIMRLIPLFNFDWVSYAAGLSRMPIVSFMTATLLGMVIPVVAIVAVGDSLDASPSRAALIFGGLLLLALIPIAWWLLPRDRAVARRPG